MINKLNEDGSTEIRELTQEERDMFLPEIDTTPQAVPVTEFRAVCAHLGLMPRIDAYLATLTEPITSAMWEYQIGEYQIGAETPDSMMQQARIGLGLSVEAFNQMCQAAIATKGMIVAEDIIVTINSIVTASLDPVQEP